MKTTLGNTAELALGDRVKVRHGGRVFTAEIHSLPDSGNDVSVRESDAGQVTYHRVTRDQVTLLPPF